jgi:hypothetical protein
MTMKRRGQNGSQEGRRWQRPATDAPLFEQPKYDSTLRSQDAERMVARIRELRTRLSKGEQ